MADDDRLRDGELRRQLATLVYSPIRPATTADAAAAVGWWNLLARLGLPLPLVVVHDFGLVLSGGRSSSRREVLRDGVAGGGVLARYQALLARLADIVLRDELIAGVNPPGIRHRNVETMGGGRPFDVRSPRKEINQCPLRQAYEPLIAFKSAREQCRLMARD